MGPETVVRPASQAFGELETLVRHLGEELAFFRRRALEAERKLREGHPHATGEPATHAGTSADAALATRLAQLEAENVDLRARLADAAERTRAMADRMRFVRQQQEGDDER